VLTGLEIALSGIWVELTHGALYQDHYFLYEVKEIKMKIMVCYDGSRPAIEAFSLAKEHAKAFGGDIIIASSMTKATEAELKDIDEMKKQLKALKGASTHEGISCETHLLIRGLSAGEDLVQFAKEVKAKEIIIGVKRRSKVDKFIFGSTCQFVILNAPCPVVTVK